jgi:V8-like Glu-specific endopeptidase
MLSRKARPASFNPNYSYWTPGAYTEGKVFFNQNGRPFVCSGTIVNSEGGNTVWTAGHCVHTGGSAGSWSTNFAFVPAYDDDLANPRPYGTWTAARLGTTAAWANNGDLNGDLGVAIMNTNFGGWHIVRYFGGNGLRVNQSKTLYQNAFGYPATAPFDGGNLTGCAGTSAAEGTARITIPCDMGKGSSGGPWLINFDGSWGFLDGVNSTMNSARTTQQSPYFGDTALRLFNDTRYL